MKKYRSLISLLIIIGAIYWSFFDMIPSLNKEQTTSKTAFSIQNALAHLKNISKKTHHVGSPEHKVVQNYIVNEFQKLNLTPVIQTQTIVNRKWFAATTAENIIVKIKGTGNGKALMLLTHYDSSPHSSLGASDAGSGVVTILEGIRAFLAQNTPPKNDVIILISDAEETGLLGAKAFVEHHEWTKEVGLVLNFESRGSGGPSYMLMETNGKNGKLLSEFIKAKPNFPAANSMMYSIYKTLPNDTDLTVFREQGNISGFNFAFIGDHFDYHTAQDSFERLDRETLLHQADYFTTMMSYFSNADLSSFESNTDYVYVNFPFFKMIRYPFSWGLSLFLVAFILYLVIVFFGICLNKITLKGIQKGTLLFLISLALCVGISFGLWKFILFVHPHYQDMLHGFTYNGYQYIGAFILLNLWLLFSIYKRSMAKKTSIDLFVFPVFLWLVINFIIYLYLPGASFFIIPVYGALLILSIVIFTQKFPANRSIFFAIISIPVLYIFSPFLKTFPVGLGLKNIYLTALFLVLLFGMLIPVVSLVKGRKKIRQLLGIGTILVFGYATMNNGFSESNKKPNSIIYVQNQETNAAYFATYNQVLDGYTSAVLGDNPIKGSFEKNTIASKYKTRLQYHSNTENKHIEAALINIHQDTIIASKRHLSFTISPQRKINKLEFITQQPLHFDALQVNGVYANKQQGFTRKNGTFLSYTFANSDTVLELSMIINATSKPTISLKEISYDLLTHEAFQILLRTDEMMPMPFVVNDAIIIQQTLKL